MALPLYLATTPVEMPICSQTHDRIAWMACHFSPWSQGLTNLPTELPPGAMLILNDRLPCQGHSPDLVAQQLRDTATALSCESVLLDFQRPPEPHTQAIVSAIFNALSYPPGVTEGYARHYSCPVFLSPAPLHIPLAEWLHPWQDREIWLEAALCQELVTVTSNGPTFTHQFPPEQLDGGFFDEDLCCRYKMQIHQDKIDFTLFDTRESLEKKLQKAHSLGITRAVGLYQELG